MKKNINLAIEKEDNFPPINWCPHTQKKGEAIKQYPKEKTLDL